MKDVESIIDHFFIGRILKIPVYQRDYSWKKENCKQLFDDIQMLLKFEGKKHFFGSIIYMIDQDTDERIIIDGQQRLTTIALLLAAIRDSCKSGVLPYTKERFVEKIGEKLYDDGEVILHTVEKDKIAYDELIRKSVVDKNTTIGANYNYFMTRISELTDVTGDRLIKAIDRLQVMTIRLNMADGDDPQAVFESINSTGLSLTEGDRIRNLILMNHTPRKQTYYHGEYWVPIENNVPELSQFFRDYLTLKESKIPKKDETYVSFRNYQLRFDEANYESFLKELTTYSRIYKSIIENDLDYISKKASVLMFHINYSESTVTYPFIMRVLWEHEKDSTKITVRDIEGSLNLIENFLVRRSIVSIPTNALNSIFSGLYRSIEQLPGDEPFFDKLVYLLLSKSGTSRFPRDSEVKESLLSKNLYERRKLCNLVLSLIENNNNDTEDTLVRVANKSLTIEHVMPQKLSGRWIEDLGEGAESDHELWVHKLGNLTLTAYNSEYSNRPYVEKRMLDVDGFLYSGLRLNEYMRNSEIWTLDQIKERNEQLTERFIQIAPTPKLTYQPPAFEKEELHSVYDDAWSQLWGNRICGYVLDGIRTDSKNAGTTFESLIKELYQKDPDTFEMQCRFKGNGQFGKYIVNEEGKKTIFIKDGMYLRYDFDNDTKIRLLRILSDAMLIDPKSLYLIVNVTKDGFHKRNTLDSVNN